MKAEYDFSQAEQGKFYRPLEQLEIPIYLDKDVKDYIISKLKQNDSTHSLNEVVNSLLKNSIAISQKLSKL